VARQLEGQGSTPGEDTGRMARFDECKDITRGQKKSVNSKELN